MPRMDHHTGVVIAEIGFLLMVFAGIWFVASEIPAFKIPHARKIVAGAALALGGVLLIIATHWGHFGSP
jgi:hypothetical protein